MMHRSFLRGVLVVAASTTLLISNGAASDQKPTVYVGVADAVAGDEGAKDSATDVRRNINTRRFKVTKAPHGADITLQVTGRREEPQTKQKVITVAVFTGSAPLGTWHGRGRTWRGAASNVTSQMNEWARAQEPPRPAGPSRALAILQGLALGLQAAGESTSSTVAAAAPPLIGGANRLLLFGGDGHKTYLGCLNCSKFDAESVYNTFGTYGSKFSATSIFNQFSEFGSKFSAYSACNPFAADPPVIVDPSGNYYGRLTVNGYADRTRDGRLQAWIAGVCAGR
jgi:hypothetical protein